MNKTLNSKIIYPGIDENMKFKSFAKTSLLRYIQFFDFECELINSTDNVDEKIHIPVCFTYIIYDNELEKNAYHKSYMGLDCVDVYIQSSKNDWNKILPVTINEKYKLKMTPQTQIKHDLSLVCAICKRHFATEGISKHRHHNHMLEFDNYVASLCFRCNSQIRCQWKLVCVAHNASYDISIILKYGRDKHSMRVLTQKSDNNFIFFGNR